MAASTLVGACGSSGGQSPFAQVDGGADVTIPDSSSLGNGDGSNGNGCHPLTCAKLGYNCGKAGDGCGGTIDCGSCSGTKTCGGGSVFSVCGGGACVPKTCASQGISCGPAGDGCGGLLQCGTCSGSDTCGGGGMDNVCGHDGVDGGLDGGACVPLTCLGQGIACGPAGDGCGNQLSCGSCSGSQTCGGGGVSSQCGAPGACTPKTCSDLSLNCGQAADGCGNLTPVCGTCTLPNICGGGGSPSVCGDVPPCTNLCLDQQACGGSVTTTLSGTVVAGTLSTYIPAGQGPDPIPNVLVYVPNSTPAPFAPGVQCAACGADVTGSPLVQATTDFKGNFTLTNVPVPPAGQLLPLVIQLGRWRRIFGLGNANNPGFTISASCGPNSTGPIRMPRNPTEGDIPFTAISTGQIDPMECVLLKMGVDPLQFTNPGAGGRIEVYQGNGAIINASTPSETALVPDIAGGTGTLDQYDQVIFPCWGKDPIGQSTPAANVKTANQQQNVVSYTNNGGRMFGTHLSYSWLYFPTDTPFNTTATWVGDPAGGDPDLEYDTGTAVIQSGASPDVTTFYNWMNALAWNGASSGTFPIIQERNNFSAVGAGSVLWMNVEGAATPIPVPPADLTDYPTMFPAVYTFNTPYSTAASPPPQCGKVVYSDFHVSVIQGGGDDDQGTAFPGECTAAPMSAQEKALEYLIWDLASCLVPPGPSCTPKTCAELGATCGPVGDGCGGLIASCGTCDVSLCQYCGAGGTPSVCGGSCCVPKTCSGLGIDCGPAGDGCGNTLQCGTCPSGMTCGGGGHNGMCGSSGGPCVPETCVEQSLACGPAGNGCGGEIQCGTCTAPETCGGGGQNGVCGPTCVPKTCQQLGFNCGTTGNGCGGTLQCGTCTAPQSCGGGGTPGQCGGNIAK